MFQITDQTASFDHMSTYAERQGEETVNGLALKFSTTLPMARLDHFAVGLVGAIYQKDGLRFPKLGPLRWTSELVGAKVAIESGDLFGARAVTFDLATVDKFQITPLEGGSIEITFRVKVKPDPAAVAVLYQLQHTDVSLTIDPATASEESEDTDEPELEGV